MVKMTLDFSTSYRAITDADITHQLSRETVTFDGNDIPIHQVILRSPGGDFVIPASTFAISTPYVLSHSAHANQLDLYSTENIPLHPYLRFPIAVNGPPLHENYVQPVYNGLAAGQYAIDKNTFDLALVAWINYLQTNPFNASAATLTDDGGLLAQFSSDAPTRIENFENPTSLFSCIIRGSGFDDAFSAGQLPSTLRGGAGDDDLFGGAGNDGIFGDVGADILYGAAGNDVMFGGTEGDAVRGGDGSDFINGGADNDLISGDLGNDNLLGVAGDDQIDGNGGNDTLNGGGGVDVLQGGTGADTLQGGPGRDLLFGDVGPDVLYGDDGNDFIRGGVGKDTLTGGAGRDEFNFEIVGATNADRIVDFLRGTDRIALTSGAFPGLNGTMNAQEFRLGTAAADGDDRILYDQATGRLFYDSDGNLNGAQSAPPVLFAIVGNHAALSSGDFFVL